ncbi:MAG: PEP/pyruvate-binding domain-containing protein [Kofleriaceae bacterium]
MRRAQLVAAVAVVVAACGGDGGATVDAGPDAFQVTEGACQVAEASASPDALGTITCGADFTALASQPLDATLPGSRSVKVIVDQDGGDALYFMNTVRFEIHYAFASTHLSGGGLPVVGTLADFNSVQYFAPDRRFLLGAVTYYEQPDRWVLELAPYDTASPAMLTKLFLAVKHAAYFGPMLAFHPTSEAQAAVAAGLGAEVPVVTTDELYAGIDYQPLSLGTAYGYIHFSTAATLASEFVSPHAIVVLDEAPNDISVVQGLITQEFQTPLSHVNVLSRNRHTPNMGLRGALTNPTVVGLDGQLVKLVVTADAWTMTAATLEEAQAWWDAHAPAPVTLPVADLSVTAFTDLGDVTPEPAAGASLRDALRAAVTVFGGKAAHYSILTRTPDVPIKAGFAIPMAWYFQFMTDNGFFARLDALLADPGFVGDPATRDAALAQLRADILVAPFSPAFEAALTTKAAEYPGVTKLRFRTSSNSEDLDGFPCAGCYNSYSGLRSDLAAMETAIRKVYADVWTFRTFEERSYYRVDHKSVGMALLVHENFQAEEANGVSVTANPFDASGLDPAFYVNVQYGGDVEVVAPPPGTTSDQLLYYFTQPNQPITYLTHSNIIAAGTTVLSPTQLYALGKALAAIHTRFSKAYGPAAGNNGWYAMDVEFKFDDQYTPGTPTLYVKQARPYPDPFGGLE